MFIKVIISTSSASLHQNNESQRLLHIQEAIAHLQWILIGRQHQKQAPKHQDMAVRIIRILLLIIKYAKLLKSKHNDTHFWAATQS